MNIKEFSEAFHTLWHQHLKFAQWQIENCSINVGAAEVGYPTIMLCTESEDYYITELLGSSGNYVDLKTITRKQKLIAEYFGQFSDQNQDRPLINFEGGNSFSSSICYSNTGKTKELHERFPVLKNYQTLFTDDRAPTVPSLNSVQILNPRLSRTRCSYTLMGRTREPNTSASCTSAGRALQWMRSEHISTIALRSPRQQTPSLE